MRTLRGTIVSNRMTKTVVVRVERLVRHPLYRRYYRVSRRYKAHAEDTVEYQIGDVVRIVETRPLSKEKRWRVVETVKKAPAAEVVETEVEAASRNQQSANR